MKTGVLLDTSFFVRLIDGQSPLKPIATQYFHEFVKANFTLYVSTISIAEYCVGGKMDDLPFSVLQVLPFQLEHAQAAGNFAATIYQERRKGVIKVANRIIIPNDTKLFAQADVEPAIKYYVSSDAESLKVYEALNGQTPLNFDFIDLNQRVREVVWLLPIW